MIALVAKLRSHGKREDGVVALMTLAFMISAGMATIVMLWSIGSITGAFNLLYSANQSAAYAAASATKTPDDLGGANQLPFDCTHNHGDPTLCDGGRAFNAASAVMATMLDPNRPGTFNLDYGSNVFLTDQNGTRNVLRSYEIGRPAGVARSQAQTYGCNIPNGRDEGYTNIDGNPITASVNCWRISEFGVDFLPKFQNAIVARSTANLTVIPGCKMSICQVTLQVVAAASQDQPTPYNSYEEYYTTAPTQPQPGP